MSLNNLKNSSTRNNLKIINTDYTLKNQLASEDSWNLQILKLLHVQNKKFDNYPQQKHTEDSEIIKDIIMNQYDRRLEQHHQKSIKRRKGKSNPILEEHALYNPEQASEFVEGETRFQTFTNSSRNSVIDDDPSDSRCSETNNLAVFYKQHLLNELEKQQEVISQTTGLLEALNLKKHGGSDRMEAERKLLIATVHKKLLESKMADLNKWNEEDIGSIRIRNIRLITKKNINKKTISYYFCLLNCGVILEATKFVESDENGNAIFDIDITFKHLRPNFEIVINLYKKEIRKTNKHGWSTIRKVFKTMGKTIVNDENSNILFVGSTTLNISNVSKAGGLPLNDNSSDTTSSILFIDSVCKYEMSTQICGFLTIGTPNKNDVIVWNKRWCLLEGSKLMSWNYPYEKMVSIPLDVIDLACNIVVEEVIISKSRTLLIKVLDYEKTYFLTSEILQDFEEWKEKINSVISAFTSWNCLKIKLSIGNV